MTSSIKPGSSRRLQHNPPQASEYRFSPLLLHTISSPLSISEPQTKGVLLYGPPGTGKTMLAKAMAQSCGCYFLTVTTSSILSKYLGDANRMVRAVFSLASKLQPCIIFVDEVDALMGKRGLNGEHEATLQVKTEFMQHWEGLETGRGRVLVMGATNRPQMIDEAILRRFSQQYKIPLPTPEQRVSILLGYLQKHQNETWSPVRSSGSVSEELLVNDEVPLPDGTRGKCLTWIASKTEGYSGSDLRELCAQAAQNVIAEPLDPNAWGKSDAPRVQATRSVFLSDFVAALKSVQPSSHKANEYERASSLPAEHPPQRSISEEDLARFLLTLMRGYMPQNGGAGGNGGSQ
jgi:SpoVK/Ycf46/Vps4 family AAA+-type ATPase